MQFSFLVPHFLVLIRISILTLIIVFYAPACDGTGKAFAFGLTYLGGSNAKIYFHCASGIPNDANGVDKKYS